MKGTNYTEYKFETNMVIKVTVKGKETEENFQKALQEAVDKAKKEIDQDCMDVVDVNEYTDYENGE